MSPRTALTPPAERLAIGFQPSPPGADIRALHQLQRDLDQGGRPFLGFPDHLRQVVAELAPLLGLLVDQQGDPYERTRFDDGMREYEMAVLTYFAALAGASPDEARGYVASSPREALLDGLAMGRRGLPEPSAYISEEAHHDVVGACELLGLNVVRVQVLPDGSMDPDDLCVQRRLRRGAGALVVATCGTPLRGAIDDVAELRAAAASYGPVHVHVDASAGGLAAAHSNQVPPWSLAHGAHSVTLSGYPLLGLPVPAGIALERRQDSSTPLGGTGSGRLVFGTHGGLGALLLWTRLRTLGRAGVAAMVARCQDVAAYALEQFKTAGVLPQRFPGSLTVTFERPALWVVEMWRLHCVGGLARITVTGPMTRTAVDELAADLGAARQGVAA